MLSACGTKAVPSYSGTALQVPSEDAQLPGTPLPAAFVYLRWSDDGVFDMHPSGRCVHSELATTHADGRFTSAPWIYKGGAKRKLRSTRPSAFVYVPGFTAIWPLPSIRTGQEEFLKLDAVGPVERIEHIQWTVDYLESVRCPNNARTLVPLYARIAEEVRDLERDAPEQAQLLLERVRTVSNRAM